jgi:glucan biosynthesis protein C
MEIEDPVVTGVVPGTSAGRLFFVDHLRVALATLVVLHHLAVVYAANTGFYYLEPAYEDKVARVVLIFFQLFNQAYFMGFFFLLAGYFTPGSFDRKGPRRFLKDRLLRLGIPLLVFMFVLNPIAWIGIYQMPVELTKITTPFTWRQYPRMIGAGPLWFVEMLLVFDIGYAMVRLAAQRRARQPAGDNAWPGYRAIGVFILGLALAGYLIRIVLPLGKPLYGFPTLAYFPQYLSFFVLGILGTRRNWLKTVPGSMGKAGFAAALGATVLLLPLAFSGQTNFLRFGIPSLPSGCAWPGRPSSAASSVARDDSGGSSARCPSPSTSFTSRSSSCWRWPCAVSNWSICSSSVWRRSSGFRCALCWPT